MYINTSYFTFKRLRHVVIKNLTIIKSFILKTLPLLLKKTIIRLITRFLIYKIN
jgi:hypothetical protein